MNSLIKDKVINAVHETGYNGDKDTLNVGKIAAKLDLQVSNQDKQFIEQNIEERIIPTFRKLLADKMQKELKWICKDILKDSQDEQHFVGSIKEYIKAEYPELNVECDYEGIKIWDDEFKFLYSRVVEV